ncbi:hypothetical protein [Agromyces aerolatus]|uniref:hypothetical protein n=1 Tax=Agromyces sp. LY-1074 TaxID=3074080 RepID=UPI002864535A|nr:MULTISPECIES: hypothetical protein [unclassified Agromyces]MDR5700574.1 hypothetical protein [Agromyces sp. LY-1074]MDR5707095.1 hypothetical protein [Agromyces sp. LY-1358]
MALRTTTTLATVGVLSLAATLGTALPGLAAPADPPREPAERVIAQSNPFDDLPDSVFPFELGTIDTQVWETEFTCPAGLPYLWNRDFGLQLNGTRWGTPNSLGKFLPKATKLTTVNGLASGWETARFSAVTGGRIYVLCTKDPAEGYAPPSESR